MCIAARLRRHVLWAPLLIVCCVTCGTDPPAPSEPVARPVRIFEVGGQTLDAVRTYPGTVRPAQEVEMAFRVGGPLIALPVTEGQLVAQGDLLAELDPRDFENRLSNVTSALDAARAELKAMQAGARPEDRRRLEAGRDAALADLKKAQADQKRAEESFTGGLISRADYEVAQRNLELAEAKLATEEAALETGMTGARAEDIEASTARIRGLEAQQREAADALADTKLVAPFAGVVARRYVQNFEAITAGQPIMNLQTKGTVDVVINVPERDMAQAPRRRDDLNIDHVRVSFEALPGQSFPVILKEFQTEADPNTQTYGVTLSVEIPEPVTVVPGMTATVTAQRSLTQEDGVGAFVPVEAVFEAPPDPPAIWRIDPATMTVSRQPVVVGTIRGGEIEILEGLAAGDRIAATGVHHLREGAKVRDMREAGF